MFDTFDFRLSTFDFPTFRPADVLKAAVRGNFDPAQFRAVDEMIMDASKSPQWLDDMLNDTHEQGWPSLLLELAGKAGAAGYLFASEDVQRRIQVIELAVRDISQRGGRHEEVMAIPTASLNYEVFQRTLYHVLDALPSMSPVAMAQCMHHFAPFVCHTPQSYLVTQIVIQHQMEHCIAAVKGR